MDEMLVEKYTDEENHIVYKKCKAFTNGKKYFLLNELGYSILIDHELFNWRPPPLPWQQPWFWRRNFLQPFFGRLLFCGLA